VVFPKFTVNELLPAEQMVEVAGVNVYEYTKGLTVKVVLYKHCPSKTVAL
jgi:hypothetical protein